MDVLYRITGELTCFGLMFPLRSSEHHKRHPPSWTQRQPGSEWCCHQEEGTCCLSYPPPWIPKTNGFLQVKHLLNFPKSLQQEFSILLELREEKVDVVCGVKLRNEGLDVLQENLQQNAQTWPKHNQHQESDMSSHRSTPVRQQSANTAALKYKYL